MKFLITLSAIFIISSCASMKPNYKFCKESNWQDLGYADAKLDKSLEKSFQQYEHMCRAFDEKEYKPNRTMYQHGHFIGVKDYCTYTSGNKSGLKQKVTSVNCKKKKHQEFYRGIRDGVNEYCSYENGYKYGFNGLVANKVCKKKSHKSFYKGVKKGIKKYCTFASGTKMGASGKVYTGACKGKFEEEFLRGHIIGQNKSEIARLSRELTNLKVKNARLEVRLEQLEEENSDLRSDKSQLQNLIEELQSNQNNL